MRIQRTARSLGERCIAKGILTFSLESAAAVLLVFLTGCVTKTPAPEEPAGPKGPLGENTIQISWADRNMAKINHIYGYNVYRSDTPTGDFAKINDDLITPSPDNPDPQFVKYIDRGLPMGRVYYYYIEAVLQDGSRHKVTEVGAQRVVKEMTPEETKAWKNEQAKKSKAEK